MEASELRVKDIVNLNGELFIVRDRYVTKPGKGGAFVQVVLFGIKDHKKIEHKFRSSEKVDKVVVYEKEITFSYSQGNVFYFLDMESCEEITVNKDVIIKLELLKEDMKVIMMQKENGEVISINLPLKVNAVVKEVLKNNAIIDGNIRISGVPAYIEIGNIIEINTEELIFVRRISMI